MKNDDQALLDELNGADSMPPLIDQPGEAAPSREAELTVSGPKTISRVQAADRAFSTPTGGAGFRVLVHGEYLALSAEGKGKIKKPFKDLTFNLPKLDAALSVIKNKMLTTALRKKYPDFVAVRLCSIVDVTPLSPTTPKSNVLAYMDRGQLEEYVARAQPAIAIDLAAYKATPEGTIALRDAIIDYVQNPEGFAKREAERQAKRVEDDELAALNPGL